MTTFKKICVGMLAAAMCFTFAACDNLSVYRRGDKFNTFRALGKIIL